MLFRIKKASDSDYKDIKEFNYIEEIRDFVKNENNENYCPSCVLYFYDDYTPLLLIYDSWIE